MWQFNKSTYFPNLLDTPTSFGQKKSMFGVTVPLQTGSAERKIYILMPDQITLYNKLRGYSSDDPCENIPQGHNPEMWKKHHNCS